MAGVRRGRSLVEDVSEAVAKGDMTWEADLVVAHHRLAVTPMYFEDGSGNPQRLTAHLKAIAPGSNGNVPAVDAATG